MRVMTMVRNSGNVVLQSKALSLQTRICDVLMLFEMYRIRTVHISIYIYYL